MRLALEILWVAQRRRVPRDVEAAGRRLDYDIDVAGHRACTPGSMAGERAKKLFNYTIARHGPAGPVQECRHQKSAMQS